MGHVVLVNAVMDSQLVYSMISLPLPPTGQKTARFYVVRI
jgi:hypothetical protein